jgi:hypothetical protein
MFGCVQYTLKVTCFPKRSYFFFSISASIPWTALKYRTEHCEVMRYNNCKFGREQCVMQSTNKVPSLEFH